ncbi:RagB/SusD family nutrient uptake outer membrane protein [Aquimarina muelleri]|nr:RagB/SusD family nutrient uptake outer membrane protein [Aquimarina muelleri]
MTTENKIIKYVLVILVLINLTSCTTMEPESKVIGDGNKNYFPPKVLRD